MPKINIAAMSSNYYWRLKTLFFYLNFIRLRKIMFVNRGLILLCQRIVTSSCEIDLENNLDNNKFYYNTKPISPSEPRPTNSFSPLEIQNCNPPSPPALLHKCRPATPPPLPLLQNSKMQSMVVAIWLFCGNTQYRHTDLLYSL